MSPLSSASSFYLYVIFLFTSLHLVRCSVDEFMSCDRYFENRRKSRVLDLIPCDMNKQSYCQEKGPGYPEGAIWKFKEENRALMRRLYGDLESTSVYREMRSTGGSSSSSSHMSRNAQAGSSDLTFGSAFSSMEYNIRVGSGLATVQSAREPVLVPSNVGRVKIKRKIMKKKRKDDSPSPSPTVQIVTSTTTSTSAIFATTSEAPNPTTTEPTRIQTTLQPTTVEIEQMTTNTISPIDSMTTFEDGIGQTTTSSETPTPPSTKTDNVLNSEAADTTANADTTLSQTLVDENVDNLEQMVKELLDENTLVESKENNLSVNIEDIVIKPDAVPEVVPAGGPEEIVEYEEIEETEEPNHSAWTYQQEEDDGIDIDYSGTPVNACPVKEEVFAPYWANNTRDQVLALLNLYPFEQYIHMETCKYEKEEMLCRRGCRCEQQYRLHRLLAFDPSNECRGIFSDWFRFPSYCICKCYNVPPEFLEKKRKPRVEDQSPISKPEVKNFRDSKLIDESEEADLFNNIPAILPYEAKVALLREISRSDRKLPEDGEATSGVEASGKIDRGTGKSGKSPKHADDKVVGVDGGEDDDKLDEHFFYGNHPVIDYKLSDGSNGAVDQIPRR